MSAWGDIIGNSLVFVDLVALLISASLFFTHVSPPLGSSLSSPPKLTSDKLTSVWLQGVAIILPSLSKEFGISENEVRDTTCALFIGLCLGASSGVLGRISWGEGLLLIQRY